MSDNDDAQSPNSSAPSDTGPGNFIRDHIDADLAAGKHSTVVTRFPPEPNGYLHIGHAKSICLNFGLARSYGGECHLRFDDTNPTTEDIEFVESIQRDVRWLGFDWGDHLYFASDYYERLYAHAEELIERGRAYVCSLSEEEVRSYRGTVTEPGKNSPYRDRTVAENLDLFRRMRAAEFAEGEHVLRAKIDMASPNMKMRDPPIYRIKKAHHYRTGDAWCIYPLYDFTHCLSDAYEGITHSVCTLEFENNRELYDWVLDNVTIDCHPQQIEFARLDLGYTVMSKRKLAQLVAEGRVSGWDDPRMPTIAGLRRRGVSARAIRAFADMIGVAKNNSTVDIGKLEYCIRDDLNHHAPRAMCVLRPLEVVIDNYPEGDEEVFEAPCFPPDVGKEGTRQIPFSRVLYIEREDFSRDPPKGFFRLAPGGEVRLRYAYVIRCNEVVEDERGEVVQLRCSYDPDTRGATAPAGRKVKGTIHWASAAHAVDVTVRLYDRLFASERPSGLDDLNPESLQTLTGCKLEPGAAKGEVGRHHQLERQGYFCVDPESDGGPLVLNRTVTLRDTWAKLQAKEPSARQEAERSKERRGDAARGAGPEPASPPEPAASKPRTRVEPALSADAEARRERYRASGLTEEDAKRIARDEPRALLFDAALAVHDSPRTVANWLLNELGRSLEEGPQPPRLGGAELGELVALVDAGTITGRTGKEVLARLVAEGGKASEVVAKMGASQLDDASSLEPLVRQVLEAHPDEVSRYREGKKSLLGFFVGQLMRLSRGQANAQRATELLQIALDS